MSRLVGRVDFDRQALTLTRYESFVPPTAAMRIPLVSNPERPLAGPFVTGKINGIQGLFLIDLGANFGVAEYKNELAPHGQCLIFEVMK